VFAAQLGIRHQQVPTFRTESLAVTPANLEWRSIYIKLTCSRNVTHVIHIWFLYNDEQIVKVGQFPSLADLHSSNLRRYQNVLGSRYTAEHNMATCTF
jgi:hypothetical protein